MYIASEIGSHEEIKPSHASAQYQPKLPNYLFMAAVIYQQGLKFSCSKCISLSRIVVIEHEKCIYRLIAKLYKFTKINMIMNESFQAIGGICRASKANILTHYLSYYQSVTTPNL